MLKNLLEDGDSNLKLTPGIKEFLTRTKNPLKGADRRIFMAETVRLLGPGGQRKAERELGWDRDTIRKGAKELDSGMICVDNFQARGRKPAEHHFPNLENDIRDIVVPLCQADPTFRSSNLYSPVTAAEVRRRLIEEKGYTDEELPCRKTISSELNKANYKLRKVQKCKPKKK